MPIPQNELVDLLITLAANLKESDLEDPAVFAQVSALIQILDPAPQKLPQELIDQVSQIPNKGDRFKAVMQAMSAEPTEEVMNQVVESMKASGLLNKAEELDKVDYHLGTPAQVHGWITPEGDYIHMEPHEDHMDVIHGAHNIPSMADAYDQGWISVGHAGMEEASGHARVLGDRRHPATLKLRELAHKHWGSTFGLTLKPDHGDDWAHHEADTKLFAKYGKISSSIDKSELDKGGLKDAAAGLAMLSATAAAIPIPTSPTADSVPYHEPPKAEFRGDLRHIASIESSGGKNKKHEMTRVGVNAGDTAAGSTGLMPITVKEAIKRNPELLSRHAHLLAMSNDKLTDHLNNHPHTEADIANHHWDRLNNVFHGNAHKMAYAWRNGISAARNATDEEIHTHPYVQKFKELRGEVKKSEELENKVLEGGKEEAPKENPADWFEDSVKSKLNKAKRLTDSLKKHVFNKKPGKLHGWVSPEGEFHPMDHSKAHSDWIAEKTGENVTSAMDQGWIAVGHGGDANFSAAHSIIANKRHPATLKLRQIFGDAYPGQTMSGDIYHMGDTHSPSESHMDVSVDHFSKYGKLKP